MLRSFSRTSVVIIAFILGMAMSFAIVGVTVFIISTNYTLRDIEENTAIPTISEQYIGEYPEVYIRDMTLVEMLKEGKELADMGDGLTLNVMISRYDLLLPDRADVFLTPKIRDLPLKQVFSEEGMDIIMNTVCIGEFKGYERREIDGESVWYNTQTDKPVDGINEVIADLTLAQTLSSDFSFTSLLDDITLADALGYTLVDGEYYKNGQKATGLIASLCDSPVSEISDELNSAKFHEILGYELGEDGCYYEDGSKVTGVMSVLADCTIDTAPDRIQSADMGEIMGFTLDPESGLWKDSKGNEVHSLMNTISGKKISELDDLYKDLTVADVIPADERGEDAGYVSLLDPETPLDEISVEVNRVFKESTMRHFVECGAITFENDPDGTKAEDFVNSTSPMADMTMDQMLTFVFNNQSTFDQLYGNQ